MSSQRPLWADQKDGRFFTVTLVTDSRFAAPVKLLTGLGEAELEANRRAFDLYSKLVPNVRVIPDRFYLTGGNLHCVLGRL